MREYSREFPTRKCFQASTWCVSILDSFLENFVCALSCTLIERRDAFTFGRTRVCVSCVYVCVCVCTCVCVVVIVIAVQMRGQHLYYWEHFFFLGSLGVGGGGKG